MSFIYEADDKTEKEEDFEYVFYYRISAKAANVCLLCLKGVCAFFYAGTFNTGVSVMACCLGPTNTGFVEQAHLETSELFQNLKNATAKEVAEYGYKK